MQVVAARHPQPLGQHPEVDAVVLLAVHHGVHGAMHMQQHALVATPVAERLVHRQPRRQVVVHDDRRAQLTGELGPFERLLDRRRGHVEVVALALAGVGLGLLDRLHHELVAVAPAHERL